MTEPPPFRIEVVVRAPHDVVWRALTDPAEIRRWFGWEYDEIDAEIRFIFVDHARQEPPDRIVGDNDHTIEVEADGPRTVVRVVKPGPLDGASWDDLYDDQIQGWRTFLHQLRHQVEHHPGAERRTLYLTGGVAPAAALAALAARVPGAVWDEGRHQRSVAVEDGGLVSLVTSEPLTATDPARGALTVTAYDVDTEAFARLREDWTTWWSSQAKDPEATS